MFDWKEVVTLPKLPDDYNDLSLEQKIVELWRFWVEYSDGYPHEHDEMDAYCFFCGEVQGGSVPNHEDFCPYVKICELLGYEVQ